MLALASDTDEAAAFSAITVNLVSLISLMHMNSCSFSGSSLKEEERRASSSSTTLHCVLRV